jgi:GNAT superfamily N-acetyltransferase
VASAASIRRAGAADLEGLVPLFDAYRRFFAGRAEPEVSRRFLAARFAGDESVVFVAQTGDELDGFIQLYPLWSSWYCARIWFLSDLYVKESSRECGIGQRLVERVIAYATETGASSVMVELPNREPHLERFYAKLGFHRDAVFDLARLTLHPG